MDSTPRRKSILTHSLRRGRALPVFRRCRVTMMLVLMPSEHRRAIAVSVRAVASLVCSKVPADRTSFISSG